MEPLVKPQADEVLAGWAPAGRGRIVVVLGQGVVIHKVIFAAGALAEGADHNSIDDSPFLRKVLRDGVDGLLASPRKTLVRWDQITAAEYRRRFLGRGLMTIRTADGEHELKFLQTTRVAGDPLAVFAHFLGSRFTGPASR